MDDDSAKPINMEEFEEGLCSNYMIIYRSTSYNEASGYDNIGRIFIKHLSHNAKVPNI